VLSPLLRPWLITLGNLSKSPNDLKTNALGYAIEFGCFTQEITMLNKEQLSVIHYAIVQLRDGGGSLRRIIAAELDFQEASEPLWAERDRILSKATIADAEELRLEALGKQLEKLSGDRPAEFGGQLTAGEVKAANIIRRAGHLLDGYVSVDRELLQGIRYRLCQMSLIATSEMFKTAGTYTDRQKADLDSINDQIDKLDKILSICGEVPDRET
jgi:hypothetical protein